MPIITEEEREDTNGEID
jgi:hypothetical protein